jgi:endonuclease/exonuclease/phosphatase (EEP) superfamily protein YafD
MKQIHKRFNNEQVKKILSKYEQGKVERQFIEEMLSIKKAQFFRLIRKFRQDESFNVCYQRQAINR